MKVETLSGSDFCGLMFITNVAGVVLVVVLSILTHNLYQAHNFRALVEQGADPIALKCVQHIDDYRTASSACVYYMLPRDDAKRTVAKYTALRTANRGN